MRRRHAREMFAGHDLSEAATAAEAIKMLDKYSPYDLVSLDHDLGSGKNNTGEVAAKYIATMPEEKLPMYVVIHSHNAPAAKRMMAILEQVIPVIFQPFNINKNPITK